MEMTMLKLTLVTAALGTIVLSTAAYATTVHNDGGIIKKLNRAAGTITLADGNTYHDPFAADFKHLRVGEKVAITWDSSDGKVLMVERQPS
jgi:Cu/Ag efflux protein CusF